MATIDHYAGSTNSAPLLAGTTYTYDGLSRLQQLSHKKVDGCTIASYTYGYDAASRIKQIISSADGTIAYQPKLFEQLQTQFEQAPAQSIDSQTEQTRDRQTQCTVSVLDHVAGLDPQGVGVQRLVRVERVGTRANRPFSETMFYISSLTLDAAAFAPRIRQHWHIENRLHWVKDVVLQEDLSPLCDGNAPANFTIVRTMALNLFRHHGFDSITQGLRRLAHDIPTLFSFFQ